MLVRKSRTQRALRIKSVLFLAALPALHLPCNCIDWKIMLNNVRRVHTDDAPAALGPYSQAIRTSGLGTIFLSGQIGLDPKTGELKSGFEAQANQAFDNMFAVAKAAMGPLNNLTDPPFAKLTLFLTDLSDFQTVNAIMQQRFKEPYPARSTVQVAALPKGALFEVEGTLAL
jgi:2-iminobutanoate/2-iminopropanoate deaminase